MVAHEKDLIKVDKNNETRSNSISVMIDDGGLGADQYYQIDKHKRNQYEAIFRQKSNTELVDLLITSAGENDNTKFNNSLLALQNEVLRRMNH